MAAIVSLAGIVVFLSLFLWTASTPTATFPTGYLRAVLLIGGWVLVLLLTSRTIFTKGAWRKTDVRLTGLYLRLAPRYVEYGHQHGRSSTPWTAIRSIHTHTLPELDNGVLLRLEADGWGPFKTSHGSRYIDIVIPNTDLDLRVVEHMANYATVGRLTIHQNHVTQANRAGEPGP